MNARGISLIELLVACALVALLGGAVAALARPLRDTLARSDASAQLEPAGRAALETIAADLREAGAGAAVADRQWRLSAVLATALPLANLDSNDAVQRGGALRIRRSPTGGAQTTLRANAAAGGAVLLVETAGRCTGGPPWCGFRPGDACVLYSADAAELVSVAAVAAGVVFVSRPLAMAFPTGAALAAIVTNTYGIRQAIDGSRILVRISPGGAEQPMLDNVIEFEAASDAANLLETTRISVRLRIEAPSAILRGPAGYLFRRAGSATSARQWVPDVEMLLSVALRQAGVP